MLICWVYSLRDEVCAASDWGVKAGMTDKSIDIDTTKRLAIAVSNTSSKRLAVIGNGKTAGAATLGADASSSMSGNVLQGTEMRADKLYQIMLVGAAGAET